MLLQNRGAAAHIGKLCMYEYGCVQYSVCSVGYICYFRTGALLPILVSYVCIVSIFECIYIMGVYVL